MSTPPLRVNGVKVGSNDTIVYLTAYGGVGDGSTDNSTAFSNAIAALPAAGGKIMIPGGTFNTSASINISSLKNITFEGEHGVSGGQPAPASAIVFTGTGSGSFVNAQGSKQCVFRNLAILYSSGSFTGSVVDFSGATPGTGAVFNKIENCVVSSSNQASVWSATRLVNLNNAYDCVIRDNLFGFATMGIRMANTNADTSNAHVIDHNYFSNFQTAAIMNAGQGVKIVNNIFENNFAPLNTPTMYPAYLDDRGSDGASAVYWCQSLAFSDNWVGDGDGSTFIFDGGATTIYNLNMHGNFLQGTVRFNGHVVGANVTGNSIYNTWTFNAGKNYVNFGLVNNTLMQGGVAFTNLPATALQYGNQLYSTTTNATWGVNGATIANDGTLKIPAGKGLDTSAAGALGIGQSGNATSIDFYTSNTKFWTINNVGNLGPANGDGTSAIGTASSARVLSVNAYKYSGRKQTVAAAGTLSVDPGSGENIRVALSATAITSMTIAAGLEGQICTVTVIQDATGGRSIPTTWTNVAFAGGTYTATATANKRDNLTFRYDTTYSLWLEISRAMNI